MSVAQMLVRARLERVADAINGYIRDGVILPSGNLIHLEMRQHPRLGTDTRSVWCVGVSAIAAERWTEDLTMLRLLAVKGIILDDGPAHRDWGLLRDEFESAGILVRSESVLTEGEDTISGVLRERRFIEGAAPVLEDEESHKRSLREALEQRGTDPLSVQHIIESNWEDVKERQERDTRQFEEIQRLIPMTTEQAAEEYLGVSLSMGEQSRRVLVVPRQRVNVTAKNLNDILFRVAREMDGFGDAAVSLDPSFRKPAYSDDVHVVKITETIVRSITDQDGERGLVSGRGVLIAVVDIQPITDELTDIAILRLDPPQDAAVPLSGGRSLFRNEPEQGESPVRIALMVPESFDLERFLGEFASRMLEQVRGTTPVGAPSVSEAGEGPSVPAAPSGSKATSARRRVMFGLLLLAPVVVLLAVATLLVLSGVLPYQIALALFVGGAIVTAAANWLGAWNNILSLVDRLFDAKTGT